MSHGEVFNARFFEVDRGLTKDELVLDMEKHRAFRSLCEEFVSRHRDWVPPCLEQFKHPFHKFKESREFRIRVYKFKRLAMEALLEHDRLTKRKPPKKAFPSLQPSKKVDKLQSKRNGDIMETAHATILNNALLYSYHSTDCGGYSSGGCDSGGSYDFGGSSWD